MKKILVAFLSLFLCLQFATGANIQGKIISSTNQSPIEFVNIALFKKGIAKPVTGVETNKEGVFRISSISTGSYSMRISFVGFKTQIKTFTVSTSDVNFGSIEFIEDSKILGAVEVVGQGSQMHFDIDKKVFSVDQNISAAGGSASDVLKNIPSVTVDNQGNVALRKDGNVEVWINGKASGLTADNRAQVLQQMPAENIESIEIMTNPSAKYSPEGSAGIINIVMKKEHKAGYYGSVSAGLTYPDGGKIGQNLGANINYSSSKLDTYVNLGYRAMSFKGGGTTNRSNFAGTDTTMLSQKSSSERAFSGLFLRAGIDYRLDTKTTLSLSGFGMAGGGTQNSNTHNVLTNYLFNNTSILKDYSQNNTGTATRPSLNLNFDYRHDFNKKGTFLTGTVSYSNHNRGENTTYNQDSLLVTTSRINQIIDSKSTDIDFKLDYNNKLTETSKLEVGWESTFSNKLSTSSGDSIKLAIPIAIPSYFDNFNYNEKIHAAYLTYGTKIGKFSYQLGLRGELLIKESTNTTKIGKTMNDTVQFIPQKSFFHIFPSFYLSYALPNDAEIQFNYSNRVNRPRGQQINPFRNYSDPTNISYGNPDLKPQYLSALELNYIKTWGAQTLSSSLYYHNTDNVIEGVRFLHHGVMESTFLNIAKSQNAGLEVISKNRLLEVLSLTSTLNMYYSKLDAATYVNPYDALITTIIPGQSIFSWSGNVMANLMLSKNLSGQITGEYESPELIAQGKETAKYTIDLGVRQTFLDRKLSVSFNIRDLLNSDRHSSITYGSGFYQTSSSYFHGRMAMMTVSYNFGNIKPKITEVKKKESGGEMNMDMSE